MQRAPPIVGVAKLLTIQLSLQGLDGIGVAALPLMPNVVFRIAVLAVQGPIMLQPFSAWLLYHPGRLQSGDPHPQHLHVPSASLSAPEVVILMFCYPRSASLPLSFVQP